ncbi:hypothetical protein [Pelosinus sp. sgz500959]|uniref:hypothetical protein n=1 Tax=Pelosinus sp. sgz500959 TaxID=3242472 RepID=UPI0036705A30
MRLYCSVGHYKLGCLMETYLETQIYVPTSNYAFSESTSPGQGQSWVMMTKLPEAQSHTQSDSKNPAGWRNYIESRAFPAAITGFFLAFVYGGILAFISTYAKSLGILARAIFLGKKGELREGALQDQLQRASILNIIINFI